MPKTRPTNMSDASRSRVPSRAWLSPSTPPNTLSLALGRIEGVIIRTSRRMIPQPCRFRASYVACCSPQPNRLAVQLHDAQQTHVFSPSLILLMFVSQTLQPAGPNRMMGLFQDGVETPLGQSGTRSGGPMSPCAHLFRSRVSQHPGLYITKFGRVISRHFPFAGVLNLFLAGLA